MNSYELSRKWFDWCFENPEKIRPIHTSIYFFAIEHCNRLGWKAKFGFPSQMVMEALGIKNWKTYSKALSEVVEFGFIDMLEVSRNQYSANIIAIVNNTKADGKATTKALDKALSKHSTKQGQSTVSIDKQVTSNKEQSNSKGDKPHAPSKSIQELCLEREVKFKAEVLSHTEYDSNTLNAFFNYWSEPNKSKSKMKWELNKTFEIKRRLATWASKSFNKPKREHGFFKSEDVVKYTDEL